MHRFFVPSADCTGTVVALPDDEAVHLTRVLRLHTGEAVRVFDGRGREWDAEVEAVTKRGVTVRLGAAIVAAPEPRVSIALAVALLKGEKMDQVVRDAVMLGVTQVIPLLTARTEVGSGAMARSGRITRWRRIAVSSAKQCGRAFVPAVIEACGLPDALRSAATNLRVMLVEPGSSAAVSLFTTLPAADAVTLFIGPEGGWTETEVHSATSAGAILTTLGRLTLRADAAPTVAVTALRVLWKDF